MFLKKCWRFFDIRKVPLAGYIKFCNRIKTFGYKLKASVIGGKRVNWLHKKWSCSLLQIWQGYKVISEYPKH